MTTKKIAVCDVHAIQAKSGHLHHTLPRAKPLAM